MLLNSIGMIIIWGLLATPVIAGIGRNLLSVGPGKTFILPSIAASFAQDGDIIEIDKDGFYDGDTVVWTQNNLILRGVGGKPVIRSDGKIDNAKAIWVIQGNNITVENVEFVGAKVSDNNGAGIRMEGENLIVRNCVFTDNQNGILTGQHQSSEIIIEHSEFNHNGHGDGRSHNLYIGAIKKLVFQFNYSHMAHVGHNLKTRARVNRILYNKFADEKYGRSSYAVEFPNGGDVLLMGNVIQQGKETENSTIVSYGIEGLKYKFNQLNIVNNTIVNDRHYGVFIALKERIAGLAINNIFAGKGKIQAPGLAMISNLMPVKKARFKNSENYRYELTKRSPAIDSGTQIRNLDQAELIPKFEYDANTFGRPRNVIGRTIDIGAYEYNTK